MSRAPIHRARSVAVLIALSIVGGSFPELATAAPTLRLPQIKPRVTIPRLPRPPVAIPQGFDTSLKWGTTDPELIRLLDEAERGVTVDVDNTASRVAANAESKARIEECAGGGLKAAGESYAKRVQAASDAGQLIPPPAFNEVADGTAGCMQTYFPGVPVGKLVDIGQELAAIEARRAPAIQSAATLAQWMMVSGETIREDAGGSEPEPVPEPDPDPVAEPVPDPPPDPDGDSPPWGLIIGIIGIAVVGAIAVAVYRASRSSGT